MEHRTGCLATFCHRWRLGHFLNSLCPVCLAVPPQGSLVPLERATHWQSEIYCQLETISCSSQKCQSVPGSLGLMEQDDDCPGWLGVQRAYSATRRPPLPTCLRHPLHTGCQRHSAGNDFQGVRTPRGLEQGSAYLSAEQKTNPRPPLQCVLSLSSNSPLPCHSTAHPSIGHFV